MTFTLFDIITLVGSLGLFLYGMKIMSEGLQKVAGERMRSILSAMTANRLFAVLTGVAITALVQSSSATTLMVVSFVNAGMLTLSQAISVIMGANVGTTVTAWIISFLGFKIDISNFAIPLVAFAIPLIFSKKTKWNSWGEFMIGFSLLFLGLQFLKTSVPDLQNHPDALAFLQRYTGYGFGSVLIFMVIGTILTIIVQSSSATVALTLIMSAKGWIPFEMATAMILGENIGTTITANLAALNANMAAKRTALSHFLFNVFGVLWVLCLFFPLNHLVADIVSGISGDPRDLFDFISTTSQYYNADQMEQIASSVPLTDPDMAALQSQMASLVGSVSIGLALFHTLFNVSNVMVMIWFTPVYVYLCKKILPGKPETTSSEEEHQLQFLSTRMLSTGELALLQVHKELAAYASRTIEMLRMGSEMVMMGEKDGEAFLHLFNRMEKFEGICDRIEVEIADFLTKLSEGDISGDSRQRVRMMLRTAGEIESCGDVCFNIARTLRRAREREIFLPIELRTDLISMLDITIRGGERMVEVLKKPNCTPSDAHISYNIENEIDNKRDELKNRNMNHLEERRYSYQASVYYLDIIDECEHYGDYALNIVQAMTEKKH